MSKPQIKYNKAPLIIMLCLTVAFVIAAALCFIVPKMIKTNAPVQLVDNKLTMTYGGTDGVDDFYFLKGELKNVSDETITIDSIGGMEVSFSKTNIKFNDCWMLKPGLPDNANLENRANYIDIVLEPGETYDFVNSTNCLTGKTAVTKLLVNLDGTSYSVYIIPSYTTALIVVFIIFAIIFLVLAFTQNKNQRNVALRQQAALEMCSANGQQCYIVTVNVADKDEKKKAAAKNAGWIIGGLIGALITGRGVVSVSSGTTNMEFVLSENSLHAIKSDSSPAAPQLTPVTRNDLTVASILTKKNKVIVKSADGKQTLTFFHDKKSPLTVEQIAEYLNNIFVKPLPQPEVKAAETAEKPEVDPFEDLATEKTASEQTSESADKTAADESGKTDAE
ncbi:MAG: hypothetical protein K2I17_04985 [Clostridia bacterium]|nr:hypothetical protein [Clostridia bacterium]